MEDLIRIIRILQPAEVKFVEKFYGGKTRESGSRRLQLFRLITEGKVHSNVEAAQALYRKKPSASLCQLKKRLKEDLLNVLLLLPTQKEDTSPFLKAELTCRKLLVQGQILVARGAYDDGLPLLEKVAKMAAKYELHEIKLTVDDLLRTHLGFNQGAQSFSRFSGLINQDLQALQEQLYAKAYSHQIMLPHLAGGKGSGSDEPTAPAILDRLREGYERTQANWVGFWYYLAAIHCACQTHDYTLAHTYGLRLQKLTERQPTLCSPPNQARVHLELARLRIHLRQYAEAAAAAAAAARLLRPHHLQALELLFYAHFRQRDFRSARLVTEQAFNHAQSCAHTAIAGKWTFLEASRLFAEGLPAESFRTLHAHHTLRKEKSGWALGYKLLELLCMLELEEYDWFDFALENFRKLLRSGSAPTALQSRCRCICQLFRALLHTNFHYAAVLQQEGAALALLQCPPDTHRWDPLGQEQIRVDEWFMARAARPLSAH